MGGMGVFRVRENDPNRNVIVETLTEFGTRTIMAQRYIPEIAQGDKRVLLIAGKPVSHCLARIPRVLYGRGDRDGWYTADQFAEDQARLRHAGISVAPSTSDDEHAWTANFSTAAGRFLQELAAARR